MEQLLEKYFRPKLPHMWCPGCGNGIVTAAIVRAIDKLGLDQDKTTIVSGIGCSSRAPGYLHFDTLHTAHGRALPFATGIKLTSRGTRCCYYRRWRCYRYWRQSFYSCCQTQH